MSNQENKLKMEQAKPLIVAEMQKQMEKVKQEVEKIKEKNKK